MLLDASYEIRGLEPVIILWGIDRENDPIVLLDKRFRPYFYALLERGVDDNSINKIIQRIKALSKPRSPILEVKPVDKRYFGKPVRTLLVKTLIPEYVREYREEVKKIQGVLDALEADIRFALRYMVDKKLAPFEWYVVEASEVNDPSFRVKKVYLIESDPMPRGREPLPDFKIMAFDIEVYSKTGSPRPEADPIIIISTQTSDGAISILQLDEYKGDKGLISAFAKQILEFDPDIIIGYNNNHFDWPYLIERAKHLKINLDIGRRIGGNPAPSVFGHISIPGRLNVDLYDFAEELPEVKMHTLEEVADYLGVMPKNKRVLLEWYQIPEYWDKPELRPTLIKYARDDVVSTYGLGEKFLPFGIQLANITGLPLDQVMSASVGFRLEWYLVRAAYERNELVPNRVERPPETYKGAIVLTPKKGVHENIAVLDFTSMYPSIMIKYNIGPDTLVRPGEEYDPDNVYIAPEIGHKFRKSPPGFFKSVLENLLRLRKEIRSKMKKLSSDSYEYRVLDERQKALKVLANASYGYMGWSGARWYCKECAEAVTAWGRATIKRAVSIAEELGLKIIYGDTDSLFVTYHPEKLEEFIKRIEEELGFDIKIDKIYKRVFFTEAKKRYVGLLEEGRIDVVGFEAIRGDWTELAKETQLRVAEIVLKEGKTDPAIEYVRKVIRELKDKKISLNKLVIWKTLTKRPEEYEVEAPHVTAAQELIRRGIKVSVGDKIGYVIIRGAGNISKRAMPYFLAKIDDIDVDYYVDHQVIPAVLRILGYFGITEAQLKAASRGQKSLWDYFARK